MTMSLDTIEASLAELEEQLLDEFNRVRNTVSENRFSAMDSGIQNALGELLDILKGELENSGKGTDLQLISRRHEELVTRMVIIRQLLKARIPSAYLQERQQGVASVRRDKFVPPAASTSRQSTKTAIQQGSETSQGGLLQSLLGLFGKKPTSSQMRILEQEAKQLEEVEIYTDSGVYSASQQLAMLANLTAIDAEEHEPVKAATQVRLQTPAGKAIFESRELSQAARDAEKRQILTGKIAQSPEEIRQKLAARQANLRAGKASFDSQDIKPAPVKPSQERYKPMPAAPHPAGKAMFASRDIENVASQMPLPKRPSDTSQEVKKPSGKAVFESRDLSPKKP
jgi:hypothetical protein